MLVVSVGDTGIGIAPTKMANLFEQFALNDDCECQPFWRLGSWVLP